MGEGRQTIIGRIARERLNQIASRKLSTMGIPLRLGADRETLEGEMGFSGLVHPITGQAIARVRFVVSGHDQLTFLDAPLAALGRVGFYEHERLPDFEAAVAAALAALHGRLVEMAARLRALQLEVTIDPERMQLRAVVKAQGWAFEIVGGAGGARVGRVAPAGGRAQEVSPGSVPLDLRRFGSSAELEAFLVASVPRAEARPASTPGTRPRATPPPGPEATPAPRNALTLARLAQVFGDEAMLPPNSLVELVQEYQYAGTLYRFVASRELGTRFKGRLIGPTGDVWSDKFELANFPGTRAVVELALATPHPPAVDPAGAPIASGPAARHPHPHRGEVWVMDVVLEEVGADEVRYTGTDIDGKPFGAARVLKRSDFEAVFSRARGGWRLLIQIDQVQSGVVLYRQLDQARQPVGAPRKMAAAVLVASFVPESAAPR